jgi:hypothetical protein
MNPLNKYGCDFYAGDSILIGRACSDGQWSELRTGTLADSFVGFPRYVHSLDLLLLSAAIAMATHQVEVKLNERAKIIAGDEGTWGAEVMPTLWVSSVAMIPTTQLSAVWQHWIVLHNQEYGPDSEWDLPDLAQSLFDLVTMCRQAIARSRDIVWVWTL